MKRIKLFLTALFISIMLLFMVIAGGVVSYDDFEDDVINLNKWVVTIVDGAGSETAQETGGYLEAVVVTQSGDQSSVNITSIALPNNADIVNLTFEVLLQIAAGTPTVYQSRIKVYGTTINELSGTGSDEIIVRNNWTLTSLNNGSFDVYRNDVLNTTIQALNSNITIEVGGDDGSAESVRVRLFFVDYIDKFNHTITNISYLLNTTEGTNNAFRLNFTAPSGINVTTVQLIWDGLVISTDLDNRDVNYSANASLVLPINPSQVERDVNFFWNITYNNTSGEETRFFTQEVNPIFFNFCSTDNTISFLNFTFQNETASKQSINVDFTSSSFAVSVDDTSKARTVAPTNTSFNSRYDFCAIPADLTYNLDYNFNYDSPAHESRTFNPASESVSNATTLKTLFLLPTSDGIFVTFQVINVGEQPISGVQSLVSRSGFGTIGSGLTNSAGTITYFLDPAQTYEFNFSKVGFPNFSDSFTPSQSSFTITLGSSSNQSAPEDFTKGITYSILPSAITLANGTNINFSIDLTSTFWTVNNFGFVIKNGSGTTMGSDSLSENGGLVDLILNTGGNTTVIMEAFWEVDGNYTNITRTWFVADTGNSAFSISNLASSFVRFLNSGLFGLEKNNNFGVGLIIFFITFTVAGVLSFKFGITSPSAILFAIFGIVAFFDVGLGIFPNPVNAIPNFPTVVMLLISLGFLVRETNR